MERLRLHASDIMCDLRQLDIVCSLLVIPTENGDEMYLLAHICLKKMADYEKG